MTFTALLKFNTFTFRLSQPFSILTTFDSFSVRMTLLRDFILSKQTIFRVWSVHFYDIVLFFKRFGFENLSKLIANSPVGQFL